MDPLPKLSSDEIKRYSRHLILPEVGMEGQQRLKRARVLLIGSGGLGSPVALYLAAAGVGTIGMVDFDTVDFSNLQRQILHGTPDVGRPKLESAAEKIRAINPEVRFIPYPARFSRQNAMQIVRDQDYDLVIDGTDNFPTRYLVNDVCVLTGKPNVYGSIFRFEGQATVFWARQGPCYRCLYPEPPPPGLVPSCAEGGVLGVLCGIIGSIQVNEAIKLLLGRGQPLIGRLLLFNALEMKFKELKLRKDPQCPICGSNPSIKQLIDYDQFCGLGRGQGAQEEDSADMELDVFSLRHMLERGERPVLVDVREPDEYSICKLEGSRLIPLGQLPQRLAEIPRDQAVVVHCKLGGRSLKAVRYLRQQGYTNCKSLKGGIDEWADRIDPTIPRY